MSDRCRSFRKWLVAEGADATIREGCHRQNVDLFYGIERMVARRLRTMSKIGSAHFRKRIGVATPSDRMKLTARTS